jgi:hypothetical protein
MSEDTTTTVEDTTTTEAPAKVGKGRRASKKPNTVFTGVIQRADDGYAFMDVKFNDSNGIRRIQRVQLVVVDNQVTMTV